MDVLVQWFVLLVCFAGGFAKREEKGYGFQMLKLGGVEKEVGGRERRGDMKGGQRGVKRRSNWTDSVLIRGGGPKCLTGRGRRYKDREGIRDCVTRFVFLLYSFQIQIYEFQ
jgi:hypothetical protein